MTRWGMVLAFSGILGLPAAHAAGSDTKPPPEAPEDPTYFVIPVKGVIGTSFMASDMKAYLAKAKALKPTVVVLEVHTPGGSVADAEQIVDLLIGARGLRLVALVRKALSAGAPITLCCGEIYVMETATLGAATTYAVDGSGSPLGRVRTTGEKFQSTWRALCRKAAQFGGHSSLLAEAMADSAMELSMRKEDGRVVFNKEGKGKQIKAYGRVLTLTARESIDCGLAKGIAADLAAVGRALNMAGWRDAAAGARRPARRSGGGGFSPADLCKMLAKKITELKLAEESLTKLQRSRAFSAWEKWVRQERLIGRRVAGNMTLVEAAEDEDRAPEALATYRDELKAARDDLREERTRTREEQVGEFVYRRPVPGDPERIKELNERIAALTRKMQACAFPFRVTGASGTYDILRVLAWVDRRCGDLLAEVPKGASVGLEGRVAEVRLLRRSLQESYQVAVGVEELGPLARVEVVVDRCRVGRKRSPVPEAPAKRAKVSGEETARRKLDLARTYRASGMYDKARAILEALVRDHPGTRAAGLARQDIEELKKLRK